MIWHPQQLESGFWVPEARNRGLIAVLFPWGVLLQTADQPLFRSPTQSVLSKRRCARAPLGEPSPYSRNSQQSFTTPLPSTVCRSATDAMVTIKDHSAKNVRRRRQRLCRFFILRGQLVLPMPADALTLGQRRNERVRVRG